MVAIVIEDLPLLESLTEEELAAIFGAGRSPFVRLQIETLETRTLMAANLAASIAPLPSTSLLQNTSLVATNQTVAIAFVGPVQLNTAQTPGTGAAVSSSALDKFFGQLGNVSSPSTVTPSTPTNSEYLSTAPFTLRIGSATFDVQSFDWGGQNSGGGNTGSGGVATKATPGTFNFVVLPNSATYASIAQGQKFSEVDLSMWDGNSKRSLTGEWKLSDATVTSYRIVETAGGKPTVEFSLSFGKLDSAYTIIDSKGDVRAPIKYQWDLQANTASSGLTAAADTKLSAKNLNVPYTLQIDNVTIPVQSFDWGGQNSGSGVGKSSAGDFNFVTELDSATAGLFASMANGNHFKLADLSMWDGNRNRSLTGEWKLSDATVTSYRIVESAGGKPTVEFSLNFGKLDSSYAIIDAKGDVRAAIKYQWDLQANTASSGLTAAADTKLSAKNLNVPYTLQIDNVTIPVQSFDWGGQNSGSGVGKSSAGDFKFVTELDSATAGLFASMANGNHFKLADLSMWDGNRNRSLTGEWKLSDATVTSYRIVESAGGKPTVEFSLSFGKLDSAYSIPDDIGRVGAPIKYQWDLQANTASGGLTAAADTKLSAKNLNVPYTLQIDNVTIPVQSFDWGGQNSGSGNPGTGGGPGKSSAGDFKFVTELDSATAGLFASMANGNHFKLADLSMWGGNSKTRSVTGEWKLSDATVTSYRIVESAGGKPTVEFSLSFGKLDSAYSIPDDIGRVGAPIKYQWDLQANTASGGLTAAADTKLSAKNLNVPYTLQIDNVTIPVQSFDWGGQNSGSGNPGTGGGPGKSSAGDFKFVTELDSATAGLFASMANGNHFKLADLSMWGGNSKTRSVTGEWKLSDATVTSYRIVESAGGKPTVEFSLSFGKLDSAYSIPDDIGRVGAPIKYQWDLQANTASGGLTAAADTKLSAKNLNVPYTLQIDNVTIPVQSFDWGGQNSGSGNPGTGGGSGKSSAGDFKFVTELDSATAGLFASMANGNHFKLADLSMWGGNSKTRSVTGEWKLSDATVTSYRIVESAGGKPTVEFSLSFGKLDSAYSIPDDIGRVGAPIKYQWDLQANTASGDLTAAADTKLSAKNLNVPYTLQIDNVTIPVQSFTLSELSTSGTNSAGKVQVLTELDSATAGLFTTMANGNHFKLADLSMWDGNSKSRSVTGEWKLGDATVTSYRIVESAGGRPMVEFELSFGKLDTLFQAPK